MQEHTKKRHPEKVELRFTGPKAKKEEAVEALRKLGFADVTDTMPRREAFPELEQELSYSIALRGARTKENMTQAELSKRAGIPQSHISMMENGKMEIGKERAKRLGEVLDIDYRLFL